MTDHGVDTAIIVEKKNGCADGMKDCFDTIGEANADEGGDEALATATEALGTLKVSTEATETKIEKNTTEKNKDKTNDISPHSSPLPLLSPPPPPKAIPLSPPAPVDIIRSRFSSWKNKADDVLRNSEMLRVAKGIVVEGSRESLGEFGSLVKRSGASKPKDAYNKHGGNGESGTKSSPRSSINRSGAELRTPRRLPLPGRKTLSPAVGIYAKKKASSTSSPRKRKSPTKTAKLRAAMFGNGSDADNLSYTSNSGSCSISCSSSGSDSDSCSNSGSYDDQPTSDWSSNGSSNVDVADVGLFSPMKRSKRTNKNRHRPPKTPQNSILSDSDSELRVQEKARGRYTVGREQDKNGNDGDSSFFQKIQTKLNVKPSPYKSNYNGGGAGTAAGSSGLPGTMKTSSTNSEMMNTIITTIGTPSAMISQESQTARILRSSIPGKAARQTISSLLPGQYVMLLGNGMLGVNLKQKYLPGGGVYVDFVVPGGNAGLSGVIHVGDALSKVGDVDVMKGTIANVPGMIASQRRPVVLILEGELASIVDWYGIDDIDVALGMVNRIREESKKGLSGMVFGKSSGDTSNNNKDDDDEMEDDKKTVDPRSPRGPKISDVDQRTPRPDPKSSSTDPRSGASLLDTAAAVDNSISSISSNHCVKISPLLTPMIPSVTVRRNLVSYASQRANHPSVSLSSLSSAIQRDHVLRISLRKGFLACCLDGRRLPFLAAYLANEDAYETSGRSVGGVGEKILIGSGSRPTGGTLLLLRLELLSYRELHGVTPVHRRAERAKFIADKFLLERGGDALPVFDTRSVFRIEMLNDLRDALERGSAVIGDEGMSLDVFAVIEEVLDTLLGGMRFASYLVSDECARMRAYLRNTKPFVDAPLERTVGAWADRTDGSNVLDNNKKNDGGGPHANHHRAFAVMHLICRTENDASDKNFEKGCAGGEVRELGRRLPGSAGGVTCAAFVRRIVLPRLREARIALDTVKNTSAVDGNDNDGSVGRKVEEEKEKEDEVNKDSTCNASNDRDSGCNINSCNADETKILERTLAAFEQLWETFVAPEGGMLDSSTHSNETREVLDVIRRAISKAGTNDPLPIGLDSNSDGDSGSANDKIDNRGRHEGSWYDQECWKQRQRHRQRRHKLRSIRFLVLDPTLESSLQKFAEELVYDYAMNAHPKYRANIFHEWMCEEAQEAKALSLKGDGINNAALPISSSLKEDYDDRIPSLPQGCIYRMLRRVSLPSSLSRHRPVRVKAGLSDAYDDDNVDSKIANKKEIPRSGCAGCAVVFGTCDSMDSSGRLPMMCGTNSLRQVESQNEEDGVNDKVKRFICVPMGSEIDKSSEPAGERLYGEDIPSTFEEYASVPPLSKNYILGGVDSSRTSDDGWQISLVDFLIPNGNNSESSPDDAALYGVSLVFHRISSVTSGSSKDKVDRKNCEICVEIKKTNNSKQVMIENSNDIVSYVTTVDNRIDDDDDENCKRRIILQFQSNFETPIFNQRILQGSWSERATLQSDSMLYEGQTVGAEPSLTIGLALVSSCNTISIMRDALSFFLKDISHVAAHSSGLNDGRFCTPLVDLLGNFWNRDVEPTALNEILNPYLRRSEELFMKQSLSEQAEDFKVKACHALVASLPSIPLALLFVTVLLEQKVVFTSGRRSILLSAAMAIRELIKPLQWSHLFVPLVPSSLANDLVQYPAPFILGISSIDKGSMELLNTLPSDVTVVDLDVGRVILAKEFSHDFKLLRTNEEEKVTAKALRTQVLHLAETIGGIFASCRSDRTWLCDSPNSTASEALHEKHIYHPVRDICNAFINELLAGTNSCCFWIEEENSSGDSEGVEYECTVVFDEDRFLQIKNLRSKALFPSLFQDKATHPLMNDNTEHRVAEHDSTHSLAISLDYFPLVTETFLRGQGMSSFISSQDKESMAFW